jgi:hypothetical protein
MTSPLRSATASLPAPAGLPVLSTHCGRRFFAAVLGMYPPIICAWIAQSSGDWGLFERSRSI